MGGANAAFANRGAMSRGGMPGGFGGGRPGGFGFGGGGGGGGGRRRLGINGVVERERPVQKRARDLTPVSHLAQSGGVDRRGNLCRNRLHCAEQRDADLIVAHRMREIDRVLDNIDLGVEIGGDAHCRIGDDDRFHMARHVHNEAVADAALRADSSRETTAPCEVTPSPARDCIRLGIEADHSLKQRRSLGVQERGLRHRVANLRASPAQRMCERCARADERRAIAKYCTAKPNPRMPGR
jgi:hypothetical protein